MFALHVQAASQAFHVDCARCSKCGHFFNEDEDMCVLGENGFALAYIRMYIHVHTYIYPVTAVSVGYHCGLSVIYHG